MREEWGKAKHSYEIFPRTSPPSTQYLELLRREAARHKIRRSISSQFAFNMQEYNFTYNDIHKTIAHGARTIKALKYSPDYLLAIGGGGLIPARIMRTYINCPILTVALSRYSDKTGTAPSNQPIKLQWLDTEINLEGKKILVIDEVDDERTTLEFALNLLLKTHPDAEFSVFVVHNKKKKKKGQLPEKIKHFFVGEEIENYWINYAWDADDIDVFC